MATRTTRLRAAQAALVGAAALATVLSIAGPAFAGTLNTPIDPFQQTALKFGDRSHWLQPWRGYLDTVPSETFRDAVGINFNVAPSRADATARLLSESGFRRARVEVPWARIDYEDRSRFSDDDSVTTTLQALGDHGIRPLILLNSHHGAPTAHRFFDARLTQPAAQGARTIKVDSATAQMIDPGRTGLNATDQYKAAAILFTAVQPDGTVSLSKPLPGPLAAGNHPAAKLAYQPFERPRLADGSPNPDFEETMAGWLSYVDVVTRRTREILGSTEFDVEVWNELSFGSDFLDARNYYDPAPEVGVGGTEREILERTVAFIREPSRGLQGVGIGNGFASQVPWDAGTTSPPGLTAIDKHPYQSPLRFPGAQMNPNQRPLDALGNVNGTLVGPDTWREDFVPNYGAFFPEHYLSGIHTEHLVRDLSPITTDIYGTPHGRATHPPGSPPPEVWVTETGWAFSEAGLTGADAAHLRAKATLRAATAFVNKGVSALHFFAAHGDEFGLVDDAFFDRVDQQGGGYPGAATAGPTMAAMGRMMSRFEPGQIDAPRQLSLTRVSDSHDQRQFDGLGSPGRPPLYNRDVLAFLPFQLVDDRFVASVYVMTRDLAKVNQPNRPATDPARFDLPAASYRLTIGNLDGDQLVASAYDPLTDQQVPVQVLSRSSNGAEIELPVTDSPRLLVLDDSGEGGPPAEEPPAEEPPASQPPASLPAAAAPGNASPVTAPSPSPPALRVSSVRMRARRLVVSGNAVQPTGVRVDVTLLGGRRFVARSSAQIVDGRFQVGLKLPRFVLRDRRIHSVAVVARAPGAAAHESRWRI